MLFATFFTLAMFGVSQAKPTNTVLGVDDLLFLRKDGNHQVMKRWEYQLQEDKREVQRRKALGQAPSAPAPELVAKRCDESTEIQVVSDTKFEDYDVAMSPVVANTGSLTAMVAITDGYSIADSVDVTTSVSATLMEVLALSLSVTATTTYTTTQTQTFTFSVPEGQHGIVISNPLVRRIEGNVLSGCTDSPTVDKFTTDSHTPVSYGALDWVEGPIRLCNSTEYPIPYCNGNGVHE
ncbi:unnamed protein product [Discula destructiva]